MTRAVAINARERRAVLFGCLLFAAAGVLAALTPTTLRGAVLPLGNCSVGQSARACAIATTLQDQRVKVAVGASAPTTVDVCLRPLGRGAWRCRPLALTRAGGAGRLLDARGIRVLRGLPSGTHQLRITLRGRQQGGVFRASVQRPGARGPRPIVGAEGFGGIPLGGTPARVAARWGAPAAAIRNDGRRWWTFQVPNGVAVVAFDRQRVTIIESDSPFFLTEDGLWAGMTRTAAGSRAPAAGLSPVFVAPSSSDDSIRVCETYVGPYGAGRLELTGDDGLAVVATLRLAAASEPPLLTSGPGGDPLTATHTPRAVSGFECGDLRPSARGTDENGFLTDPS